MNLLVDACSPFICSELEEALVKQSGKGFNYTEHSEVIRDYDIDLYNKCIEDYKEEGFPSKLHWKFVIPTLSVPVNVIVIFFDTVAAADG